LTVVNEAPKAAVVITTSTRGLDFLPGLLPTIERQSFRDHEVTVAVDGADPATLSYLREEWPAVRVASTPEMRGFASCARLGMDSSRGEYIALMNDDIELEPDWLGTLVAELEGTAELGFVTGKTLLLDRRNVINETRQDFYSCGRFEAVGLLEEDTGQYDRRQPTAIASASASVYRREAVDAAGGIDTDYFIYCEDADLCLRMLLCGYRGLYVPEARAYHAWAPTMGRTSERSRFLAHRNTLTTMAKDIPVPVLLRSLPKILLYQGHVYGAERGNEAPRTLFRSWASFVAALPATLRKRRRLMRSRVMSTREFRAFVIDEYPVPTRLRWGWISQQAMDRVIGPILRFGGDLLEHVPERIRPRIRGRDRMGDGGA
jgi:GT2 family glycosyltransferase